MFSHLFRERKFSKLFFAKVLLENQVFEIFFSWATNDKSYGHIT
jgi:hypothetical protein